MSSTEVHHAYIKVAAANFAATLLDTDDLGTVRGSSLTVLRAPDLLLDHLRADPPAGVRIADPDATGADPAEAVVLDVLYASASECVLRLTAPRSFPTSEEAAETSAAPALVGRRLAAKVVGKRKKEWNRLVQSAINDTKAQTEVSEDDLRSRAQDILDAMKGPGGDPVVDTKNQPIDADALAGHLLTFAKGAERGPVAAAAVPPPSTLVAAVEDVLKRARDFLDRKQPFTQVEAPECQSSTEAAPPHWPLDLFSFLCVAHVCERPDESLDRSLDHLTTALGIAQLSQLSVALPALAAPMSSRGAADVVCRLTKVLPVDPSAKPPGRSASAARRRAIGMHQKTDFYRQQLVRARDLDGTGLPAEANTPQAAQNLRRAARTRIEAALDLLTAPDAPAFAGTFQDIVTAGPADPPPVLANKLCVVYLDGNSFGKARMVRARDQGFQGFRQFSRHLEVLAAGALGHLLSWMHDNPTLMQSTDATGRRIYRFETLLWGGDEMAFVLPAWAGWRFAAELARTFNYWDLPPSRPDTPASERLTFAIGLAFGHVKTPIRDLRAVASALSDAAKHERAASMMQVLALEGIDRAQFDLAAYRRQAFGDDIPVEAWSIPLGRLSEFTRMANTLRTGIGRSQLHRWVGRARQEEVIGAVDGSPELAKLQDDIARAVDRLDKQAPVGDAVRDILIQGHGGAEDVRRPMLNLAQLSQLWDYIFFADDVMAAHSASSQSPAPTADAA